MSPNPYLPDELAELLEPEERWDIDEPWKDRCACGHSRGQHKGMDGACMRTRTVLDTSGFPPPEYPNGDDPFPIEDPVNWPPRSQWPTREVPCCSGFYDAGLAAAEAGPS